MDGKAFFWLLSFCLSAPLTCLVSYLRVPGIRPLVSTRVFAGPGLKPFTGEIHSAGIGGVAWCWAVEGAILNGLGLTLGKPGRGRGRGRGVLLSLSFESPLGPGVSRSHLNVYRYSLL